MGVNDKRHQTAAQRWAGKAPSEDSGGVFASKYVMRHFINLAEAVGPTDKNAIVSKMVDCVIDGRYWDDQAQALHPGRFQEADDGAHMIEYWRAGDFEYPFPDRLESMEDIDVQDTPEFRQMATWWLDQKYDYVVDRLSKVAKHNGLYSIKRVMKVSNDWLAGVKRTGKTSIGIYWTYDADAWDFEPVWSDSSTAGVDVVFHALVSPDSVDWHYTIMAGMDWQSGENEFEIRLRRGAALDVFQVDERFDRANEREIDMKGVVFTA